jgi:hypothetical protein
MLDSKCPVPGATLQHGSTGTEVLWSAACPKFSGLLLRKNMRGTNVARLRISVWFVGNAEVMLP